MYIVLIGPAGRCRKTVAVNIATGLLENLSDVKVSADSTTREALIRALKLSEVNAELKGGRIYTHSSLTIISKELSVFLGTQNKELLALLTDLYDCPNKWEYRTKNQGIDTLHNVWLNMLAASTPDWLVGSIPLDAIGGGYTSRVVFVVEESVRKKNSRPILSDEQKRLGEMIVNDLEQISMLSGEFKLSPDAEKMFDEWYNTQEDVLFHDKRFWGYAERKHVHLLKVSLVLAIADRSEGVIEVKHLKQGLELIELAEAKMVHAFGAVGRSDEAIDIGTLTEVIKEYGEIERRQLLKIVWRDVPMSTVDSILRMVMEMGDVTSFVRNGMIYYKYVGEK